MPSKRITAAVGAALVSAAVATAAPANASVNTHPKPGKYAQMADANNYEMELTLAKHKITYAEHYDDCVKIPIMLPKIKVTKGRFHYKGTAEDPLGNKWKMHLTGKFTSRTKATGDWEAQQVTGGSCTSSFHYKVHWVSAASS